MKGGKKEKKERRQGEKVSGNYDVAEEARNGGNHQGSREQKPVEGGV